MKVTAALHPTVFPSSWKTYRGSKITPTRTKVKLLFLAFIKKKYARRELGFSDSFSYV